jgi:hypothetical protein
MPDLLIATELRDAVRDLILRGYYPDDPASDVLGAVVQLNGLAAPAPVAAPQPAKPRRQRGRPRRGLAVAPDAATPSSVGADASGTG